MRMICQDCIETNAKFKQEAEIALFPYWEWPVRLLCQTHFDEYAYAEGEMNLDYYHLDDLDMFFRELNKKLKFLESRHLDLLKEWGEMKKTLEPQSLATKVNEK